MMFGLSVRLFRVFGIDVKIDLSWALIATFIAWSLAQGVFPQIYQGFAADAYWWMALGAVVGLALSIIAHELAHSLVARRLGLPLKSITLFIFGGVAELDEEPKSPRAEFVMAIVGPLASVALALFFGWAAARSGGAATALGGVLDYLSLINWVLAVFNMLPALPLDGGRALRAVLWGARGDIASATRIASRAGVFLGVAMIAFGAAVALLGQFVSGLWWVLIGLFIRSAAASAVYQDQMLRLFRGAPVRDFMTREPVAVRPDITLRAFIDDYVYVHHFDLFAVVRDADLLGAIGLKETRSVPRREWDARTVGEAMAPISEANTIAQDADALAALKKMHENQASRLLVVENGRLVGVLALKDLLELLSLKLALEGR